MTSLFGDWAALMPLLVLAGAGMAMLLVDAFVKENAQLGLFSAVILAGTAMVSIGLWDEQVTAATPALLGGYLASDRLALFADVAMCLGAALASLLAGGYLREHKLDRGEFYVLLVWSTLGAMALVRATDLLSLFVSLEALSLGVYCLVAFRRHSPKSAEGAMKYFLLGSFASAILLFGMALLYGATVHTDFAGMAEALRTGETGDGPTDLRLGILGMALVLVGLAFKVSAVPFHMWTPDAYEGAVTPATTFMAVVVKAATIVVLVRVFFGVFGTEMLAAETSGWPSAVFGLAAITLVVGNVAALVQKNVKRMLAYSSIAHAGFLLVGIAAAAQLDEGRLTTETVSSVLFYVLAYTVSNVLAFGSLIVVGSRGKEAVSYEDLAGVGRRHPWVGVPFTLGILSLMGFPPTAGFFAKYWILEAAVNAGGAMTYLAILAVLMSAVGSYYYLKVLVYLFMKQPEQGAPVAVPMRSGYVVAALVLSSYFVLRMGLAPTAYLELAQGASYQLAGLPDPSAQPAEPAPADEAPTEVAAAPE
ncbi:MAG: NADH-quinone oxidoreductase subunit N [Sandaracinaceae bacterium]|nr:NADH-quinone oxidoreductase subunit N [Sandaracinaceae bacterium]